MNYYHCWKMHWTWTNENLKMHSISHMYYGSSTFFKNCSVHVIMKLNREVFGDSVREVLGQFDLSLGLNCVWGLGVPLRTIWIWVEKFSVLHSCTMEMCFNAARKCNLDTLYLCFCCLHNMKCWCSSLCGSASWYFSVFWAQQPSET